MALGKRVTKRRKYLKITSTEVAYRVTQELSEDQEFSQQRLNALESRDSKSCAEVYELAIALETNVAWLSRGIGDAERQEIPYVSLISDRNEEIQNLASLLTAYFSLPKKDQRHIINFVDRLMAHKDDMPV